MNTYDTLINWLKGTTGASVAVISSFQESLDFWTKYGIMVIGGMFTLLSLIKLIKNWNK